MTTTIHATELRKGDVIAGRTITDITKYGRLITLTFDDGNEAAFDREDFGATFEVKR